ncbi:hypothetical protein [Oenococcus kitaharae]|uniref:Uncharacterized protein n=1 Tax=Oenococcus kitaharae DSM 17330 TaxID=1045004 RepID=G9WIV2_9LACO|nr:hypothetical protein [Oenococcus kitaharae]EHN58401.1 hypothetical protein OKIT_0276 [Oenococcus kitaharae DSM 17330]OEY81436.1 hypothetical protein NT95_07965 [Oenococcus kitaharae]OEY82924.1 hypothetical protein NV75_06065 [Oenococcus kitaharae]OEY84532.1 hypothetical protein NT96_04570 [Oenococcus kitaharae]
MKKKSRLVITISALLVIIAAGTLLFVFRPAQLSTTHNHYRISGMSANIRGTASPAKQIQYRVGNGTKRTIAVRSGSFAINLPASDHKQIVTIYNHGRSKKVTVSAATALADYQRFAGIYNQALIASRLPKHLQQIAKNPAADPAKSQQQAAELAAAMAKIQKNSQKELLPVQLNNTIRSLPAQHSYQLRINVRHQQLIGITLISPLASLRNQKAQQTTGSFVTVLALIAQASGADPSQVLKDFGKTARQANNAKTTSLRPIRSKGVQFDLGVSTQNLYVYVGKYDH